MKPLGCHNYFVYILTNKSKAVLYTGVTNDLKSRLNDHKKDSTEGKQHFAGKYNCFHLLYWERFEWIEHAIEREKEIKGWRRDKKIKLITEFNPQLRFLNDEIEDD